MIFDPNQKNVAHMYLGTVHNGTISYRVATDGEGTREHAPPTVSRGLCRHLREWLLTRVLGKMESQFAGPRRPDNARRTDECGVVRTQSR